MLQLARAHGRVRSDDVLIAVPLTHELPASMIGSARETVTGALGTLEREGFVAREGRHYAVKVSADEL